jgi:hypothetical protein
MKLIPLTISTDTTALSGGHEAARAVQELDYFWLKAFSLIGVVVLIFILIGSINHFRRGWSYSKGLQLHSDELVFDRSPSLQRIIVYFSLIVFIAIPLFVIVHIAVACIVVIFLLAILPFTIYFDVYANHSRVVINRTNRTVVLSSTLAARSIKPEECREFKELVFSDYFDNGYAKYALYLDEVNSSQLIWNDFRKSDAQLILNWATIQDDKSRN